MAVVGATRGEETLPVRLLRGAVGGLLAGLVFAAVTMWFADSTAGKADMPRMISTIVKGDLARPGGRRGGVLRRPARPVAAGRRRPGQDPGGRRAARPGLMRSAARPRAAPRRRWPASSACWNAAATWCWRPISPRSAAGWAWSPRLWRPCGSPGPAGSTSGWSAGRSRTWWRRSCSPSSPMAPARGWPDRRRSPPTCGAWDSGGAGWSRAAGSRRSRRRSPRSRRRPNGARPPRHADGPAPTNLPRQQAGSRHRTGQAAGTGHGPRPTRLVCSTIWR